MNTKGGCGKTTVATNLASLYAQQGYSTALFDFDPQGSSTHWLSRRSEQRSSITGVEAFRTPLAMTRSWQLRVPQGAQRVVLDTPASMDRTDLMERVRDAHAVLIPVLPSPIDAHATANFIRDLLLIAKLRSDRTMVGIIPNRVRTTTLAFQALQRFLSSLSFSVVTTLYDSQLYVQAAENGAGVHELDDRRARRHAKAWQQIYTWLEQTPAVTAPNRPQQLAP